MGGSREKKPLQAADPISEVMELQMGPSHPATHGTIKFNLKLDGETIVGCDTEIGYLHRGFEKMCEQGTWTQCIPYTDRLNYASPLINNFIFCEAVERLLGITVPERCSAIRVLLSEMSRIADHLTCLGMAAAELGAITPGFYMNEARETLYNLNQLATGARVTVSYGRIGGLRNDLPEDFEPAMRKAMVKIEEVLRDCEKLLERNRIFIDRMVGVGVISREDAISYGLTGPLLRATGVARDLRKDEPYMGYEQYDFDVPVGTKGDNFDRFAVRFEEMRQSLRIIDQVLRKMPGGPISIEDHTIVLPQKEEVYGSIEGLMAHFKLIVEGIRVPEGEVYFAGEATNGELGFYLVSDGSGRPYRVRVRPPCFYGMAALEEMIKGHMVSDVVATFGMINMIGGECDR
ncbi:MAG: NADH-quinone oxidoreductase subunit D [Candidatus Dadabacteria bacterium]|nr:MAG: NADH-quinone oxidoreductase subunit D [Candidatus Dadabacteria bacterium]